MACEIRVKVGQSIEARRLESAAALERLEAQIAAGRVRVAVGASGGVAFKGWNDRDDLTDHARQRDRVRR